MTSDKMNKTRRVEVETPRPAPEVRQAPPAADHLPRPRRDQRDARRRHRRDHGDPPALEAEAVADRPDRPPGRPAGPGRRGRGGQKPRLEPLSSQTRVGRRREPVEIRRPVARPYLTVRATGHSQPGCSHDPDANAARRGRQHRGQGSDVLQGPRRQRLALQAAHRRPGRRHHRQRQEGLAPAATSRPATSSAASSSASATRPAAPTAPTSSSTATPSS